MDSISLLNSESETFTVTVVPADNEEMDNIKYALVSGSNLDIQYVVSNNVVTFTIANTNKVAGRYDAAIYIYVDNTTVNTLVSVDVLVEEEKPIEIPITDIIITGKTLGITKEVIHIIGTVSPNNNTSMIGLRASSTGGGIITNQSKSNNIFEFDVTYEEAGDKVITIEDTKSNKRYDYNIVIEEDQGTIEDRTVFIGYSNTTTVDHPYLDNVVYGGYVNLDLLSEDTFNDRLDAIKLVAKSGKVLKGWIRNYGNGREFCENLTGYGRLRFEEYVSGERGKMDSIVKLRTPSSQAYPTGELLPYSPLYNGITLTNKNYNGSIRGVHYKIPAGNYKVRFISSTANTEDSYKWGKIIINNIDVSDQLPTEPYIEKQQWTDWINFSVGEDNLLNIYFINTTYTDIWAGDTNKIIGFNAIEIDTTKY